MKHSTFCKKINFNKLIILDCLSDGECQTAKHLYENLSDKGFREGVSYLKVPDVDAFRIIIQEIKEFFNPELDIGFQPIIHIEAHGSPLLMELADKSTISWVELANDLREINKLMKNKLIIFIGTCHGYHFILNNHTIKKFSPAYFCIAPLELIPAHDVEIASFTFYNSLLTTGNLTTSANLLDSAKIYTYNSDFMFHKAFYETMQKNHRGKNLEKRKEYLLSTAIQLLGDKWNNMNPQEKDVYLKKSRSLLNDFLKDKESLKIQFNKFSIQFMGYANEDVFEEIWKHMQENKQGNIY
ncbi:hypothetical protein ABLB84_19080 [Xenorhabdus szentirmaii]|uniref:hypothetical protein n=1 Tax=Xenorhabdus szentirmaii TaxID=290112 RepID=UPI0032B80DE5